MHEILIIDSHKGTKNSIPQNLHWKNSKAMAYHMGADLIWSYPTVNNTVRGGYEKIILVHASHYSYVDYEWLLKSPDAKLFYVTNEYNLGEPRILWLAVKDGRKYDVIANHPHPISKIVMEYVNDWHIINLNALIYNPIIRTENTLFSYRSGCIYYGNFRKDRAVYFKKYLDRNIILSTHPKNVPKFRKAGATSMVGKRIDWNGDGLYNFKSSLYIEDVITHDNYNYLANRFYEALNYDCVPLFAEECRKTVELSGYNISDDYFIRDSAEIRGKNLAIKGEWHTRATREKMQVLRDICKIIKK